MRNSAYINPANKDYILYNGQILNEETLFVRINMALYCPLGSWKFNPQFGCAIYKYLGATSQIVNKRLLELAVQNALQFLIADGSLINLSVLCTSFTLTSATINIYCTESNQNKFKFVWKVVQLEAPLNP